MAANIDFTIDFDSLLEEAKNAKSLYDALVDSFRSTYNPDPNVMSYPSDVKPILKAAHEQWETWLKLNITDHGLELHEDALGRPVAISAVLAGKKA